MITPFLVLIFIIVVSTVCFIWQYIIDQRTIASLNKDISELHKFIAEQARDISEQEQIIDQLEEDREA